MRIPAIVIALLVALPVQAAESQSPLDLNYSLYAGGLKVVDVNVHYGLQEDAYDVYAIARTRGMWKSLVPWRNVIKSFGTIDENNRLHPQAARYDDVWREKARTTEFTFKPDGSVTASATPPHRQDGRAEATAQQRKGAVDPVAALMAVMAPGATTGCKGRIPAFDGRRLFNLVLENKGTEQLPRNRYGMYSGQALRCEVTFEPVAGFPTRGTKAAGFWSAQDNSDKRNPLIIWIARPSATGPEIPVRVQSNTEYGTIVAHLRSIEAPVAMTAMAAAPAAR